MLGDAIALRRLIFVHERAVSEARAFDDALEHALATGCAFASENAEYTDDELRDS